MPGNATRLGPFAGGLNTVSDPTAVADQELVDVVNFELDLDGSLTSRPPIVNITSVVASNFRLLGYYVDTATGTYTLLATSAEATPRVYTFDGATWTQIAGSPDAMAMTQYQDKAWLVAKPGGATNSGWWTPSGGFTAVAAMHRGYQIQSHKNRLWITQGKGATSDMSRIKFSSVTDPLVWNVGDFLDISPGDGQGITDFVIHQNSLMIFKNDSTYSFSYDSAPDKGVVNRVSATVGASDHHCVVPFENMLFVYHEGNVYELINYNYTRLNTKVEFTVDNSYVGTFVINVAMSIFNNRLVVRHYDRVYVFNLRTRSWSRWVSNQHVAYFVSEPKNAVITDISTGYAAGVLAGDRGVNRIKDAFNNTDSESMECWFQTKNYDYQISSNFKRLHWWGADVISQSQVDVIANPIVYNVAVTWDQLDTVSWDDFQTWDQMLTIIPTITDSVATAGAGNRKFLKFNKSLRFRQINFKVSLMTNGLATQAPAKVFSLITYISTKETVSKKIS